MNSKRIVIVTLFDDNNIGNRLQNYALQQVLFKCGTDVTVLDNGYTTIPNLKTRIKENIKGICGAIGNEKYNKDYQNYISKKRKRKANKKFDRNNIKKIVKVSNQQAFNIDWSQYAMAVAGSDQIWHKWRNDEYELPFYYLQFMPPEKRMAYAASFGFNELPSVDISQHEQGMRGMKCISCREKSGCEIASNITGKRIQQVLDPTLLLTALEWRELEKNATVYARSQENYAFIYFLGEKTDEYMEYIKNVMKINKIDNIIDFSDIFNRHISECGPCGFLSLIDRAEYVFTDSFHCTVFSVLFEKRFKVFKRRQPGFENMFGRIEDLLASKGKLENIYGGSAKKATNDFEKLYMESMQYIDSMLRDD